MAIFRTPDGCRLHYDVVGRGSLIVLTPGGRYGRRVLASLVDELAGHFTVLTWDRRNCGDSDLCFDGRRSEQSMWAADLVDLVHAVGERPAVIGGGSAGCRVSLNAALRDPTIVESLVLWSASGGAYGSQFLGFNYHVPFILAAQRGGMAEVAATPFFAERIAANPNNASYLAGFDTDEFIATMKRWNESFYPVPGEPLTGIEGDLGTITAPTLIFRGNDDIHPAESSDALAAVIAGARVVASPWSTDEFMDFFSGAVDGSVFDLYPRLVPDIRAFLTPSGG